MNIIATHTFFVAWRSGTRGRLVLGTGRNDSVTHGGCSSSSVMYALASRYASGVHLCEYSTSFRSNFSCFNWQHIRQSLSTSRKNSEGLNHFWSYILHSLEACTAIYICDNPRPDPPCHVNPRHQGTDQGRIHGGSAFENGRISNFQGLMTLTLTLDRVIVHTVVHHSSTSRLYLRVKFHWNQKNFLSTDGRMYRRTDIWDPVY